MSHHSYHPFAIYNRETPIGQLPVELLSDIFHIGLQEYGLDDHHAIKYLCAITSTCSAWRDTALGTPLLWQRIIYKEPAIPKPNGRTIPRHTKDRLQAFLSRSKDCNLLLHLDLCASTLRAPAIKKIVYPHLARCLAISLSFNAESDIKGFLPLPGDLCRLTEFTCISHSADLYSQPRIFVEPQRVTLRKLTLDNACAPLSSIGTQGLQYVRLKRHYGAWPECRTFISRCHSLTTLIISYYLPLDTDRPFAPFTLPNLIHLDILGFEMLRASHTPNLQTLIIREGDNFDDTVIPIPSWTALTTLIIMDTDMKTVEIISLLVLNPGIKRLILSDCVGIHYMVQLLKGNDMGGAANIHGTTLLPSLSLLRVWQSTYLRRFQPLFAHRPTLRIEHGGPGQIPMNSKWRLKSSTRMMSLVSSGCVGNGRVQNRKL